jgi:carbon storage regulator CsrA
MLVLSRKEKQSILFPNLGITVEICRIAGKTVRVGVDAPAEVRVLRQELAPREILPPQQPLGSQPDLRHELRNRLNTTGLAMHVLQRQLDAGNVTEAEETLALALDEFSKLDRALCDFAMLHGHAAKPARPRRALLVEDNANERELLAGLLRMNGYDVETAEDGLAALSCLSQNRPDLVLLDMLMPRMDGRQTIAAIRGNPDYRGLKVFVVSGSDRDLLPVETGPNGVDRWFSKPISPTQLVHALEKEMNRVSLAV